MPRSRNGEVERCSVGWGTISRAGWGQGCVLWTPLLLFFSGDTAAGPRDYRKMRRPKASAMSSPPEPFWLTFFFSFFLGGAGGTEVSLFLTLHSSLRWDGRLLLTRRRGQREGARGRWRLLWCVRVSDACLMPFRQASAFPRGWLPVQPLLLSAPPCPPRWPVRSTRVHTQPHRCAHVYCLSCPRECVCACLQTCAKGLASLLCRNRDQVNMG